MKIRIVIPARLKSTRFPEKLIQKVKGKTIIEHVCLRAKKIKADSIIVATDSETIRDIIKKINIDVWYSEKIFLNGTERISAVSRDLSFKQSDIVINIQADEFNFPISAVNKCIDYLKTSKRKKVATIVCPSKTKKHYTNKDSVKVLTDNNSHALFFSRSPVPYNSQTNHLVHLGIYGYHVSLLNNYHKLVVCPYESAENLEQLRFLWNEIPIKCIRINSHNSISINSSNDLKLAKRTFK